MAEAYFPWLSPFLCLGEILTGIQYLFIILSTLLNRTRVIWLDFILKFS